MRHVSRDSRQYLLLTTYYLLPLTTYYLLLTTYNLLLTTHYLLLTTYYKVTPGLSIFLDVDDGWWRPKKKGDKAPATPVDLGESYKLKAQHSAALIVVRA